METSLRDQNDSQRSTYDLNVLKELDCLVTQRRIHSIYHRNIPIPNKATIEKSNETSPSFLDDEAWWRDFINEDFDMGHYFDPSGDIDSNTILQSLSLPSDNPTTSETPLDSCIEEIDFAELLELLPACSHCRDRRIKCRRQLPTCKGCERANRECVIFDPVLSKNIPLR